MALLYKENGQWMINGAKHRMESLDKVAQTDPGYLWWAWHNVGPTMDDETFYALVDTMERYKIPFDRPKG